MSDLSWSPVPGRLLQFNLVNSTDEPVLTPDYIRLYDGDIYNVTSRQMARLSAGTSDATVLHVTNETSLSVQLHASGAGSRHGFIAEVVTLPVSSIGFSESERTPADHPTSIYCGENSQ